MMCCRSSRESRSQRILASLDAARFFLFLFRGTPARSRHGLHGPSPCRPGNLGPTILSAAPAAFALLRVDVFVLRQAKALRVV